MNASNKKDKNVLIFVNGIGKHEFTFWRDALLEIIHDRNSKLTKNADLSDLDLDFINKNNLDKEISCFERGDITQEQFESIFFTDTADCINIPKHLPHNIRKFCLFGGFGNPSYQEQIKKAQELNFQSLFSDILPEEIANEITEVQKVYLEQNFIFIPPFIADQKYNNVPYSEKILILSDSKSSLSKLSSSDSILINALMKIDQTRSVYLTDLKYGESLNQIIPSNDCNALIDLSYSLSCGNLVSQMCHSRGIKVFSFEHQKSPSPIRNYFSENTAFSLWINDIFPLERTSIRQKVKSIINQTKNPNFIAANDNSLSDSLETLKGHLFDKDSFKLSKAKINLVNDFNKKYSNLTNSQNTNLTHVIEPFKYLTRKEKQSNLITKSLNFYYELPQSEFTNSCLQELIECCLRIAINLPFDGGLNCSLYQAFNRNPVCFISAFKKIFSQKLFNNQEFVSNLFSVVQQHRTDSQFQKLFFDLLGRLNLPPIILSRIFLAKDDLEQFEKVLDIGKKESIKGLAGAAIYQKIIQTNNIAHENLERYSSYCEDEIRNNLHDVRTVRSNAFCKILLNSEEDITNYLSTPSEPRNDFRQFPISWHEIALFSIFQGRMKEAGNLLLAPKDINGGCSSWGRIGALAIALILEEHDLGATFAKDFPQSAIEDCWSPKNPVYMIAFYHLIIFKYCGLEKESEKLFSIMTLDCHSLDEKFKAVVDLIPKSTKPKDCLVNLALKLWSTIKFINI